MVLRDREGDRKVITHRIACGRPGRPPKSLDYLEITTTEQPGQDLAFPVDVAAMDRLVDLGARYATRDQDGGIKPRRIPIRVDSDDTADFLLQAYRTRVGMPVTDREGNVLMQRGERGEQPLTRPKVWCQGDGVQAKRWGSDASIACCASPRHDPRTQQELAKLVSLGKSRADPDGLPLYSAHKPEDGRRCPFAQNNNGKLGPMCKPETVLICRSDVVSNLGAFCRVRSHGHYTADALASSFEQIKSKMPGGILADVPLDLVLSMKRFPVPGSTATTAKPVLHVELRLPVEETVKLLNANLTMHLQVTEGRRILEAARVEAEENDDVDAAEFTVVTGAEGGGGLS